MPTYPVRLLSLLLLAFIPRLGLASVVLPGDGPYQSYTFGETRYVFDGHARSFIHDLAAYNQAIREIYNQSFAWQLDEREDLVLTSPRQQVANAYATFFPSVKTVWFPSGAGMLEEMAQSSWLLALTTHETAHLYQLNAKGEVSSAFKKIFRNMPWTFFFGIPVFIHPNAFTPTFLLEGNATFNESRFNIGGRLHSGEKRALVFSQILAGDINPNRLINLQLKFPYGEEAYLQGGYFFAHLARKYGVDKANQFFLAQGDHWLNPLILNNTFRKHFGASYPQEIREFVRGIENQAGPMKTTEGPALAKGVNAGAFNRDKNSIWILLTDGIELPKLVTYDKTGHSLSSRAIDLPLGKVFYNNALKPESAASLPHDLHHIEYSLYGEGLAFNKDYRGQIVTDQREGKTAALDATRSWLEPQLLINGQFFDVAHSSAILDDKGSAYYFRQNGTERILYKDREPLTKYKGFYGKPCDIGDKGEVYFIANTDFGSSLYKFENQQIIRVLPSDTIVDAAMVSDTKALVLEVTNKGYELKIAEVVTPVQQSPAVYDYGFPTQNLNPAPVTDAIKVSAEQKSYNSLTHTRLSAVDFTLGISDDEGLIGSSIFAFSDPLEWSSFNLHMRRTSEPRSYFGLAYDYSRYLIDILAIYDYSFRPRYNLMGERLGEAYSHQAALGLGIPLLQWRRWSSELQQFVAYENDDAFRRIENWGSFTRWNLNYTLTGRVAMFPRRYFDLSYSNKLEAPARTWTKTENTSTANLAYVHGLPQEFYFRGIFTAAWAETRDITVEYGSAAGLLDDYIDRLTGSESFDTKRAYRARLEASKVIYLSSYSPRIPFGLRRLAPFIVGQSIAMDDAREDFRHRPQEPTLLEYGYGFDLEILLLHRIPVIMRMLNGYDNLNSDSSLQGTLSLHHEF